MSGNAFSPEALALFKQVLDSTGFREAAARSGLREPKSNWGYASLQLIEQLIVSIGCGTVVSLTPQ